MDQCVPITGDAALWVDHGIWVLKQSMTIGAFLWPMAFANAILSRLIRG